MSMMTGAGSGYQGLTGKNKIPKGYEQGQVSQFTPEQMNLFQSLFSQAGPESFLGKLAGGDQSQFEQSEAPALQQFQGLQGNLASRFSGMGSGALRSSGFKNTLNQASSDFAQGLQSRRMDYQRQAIQDMMGLSQSLLGQRPYDNFLVKKQQQLPFWKQLLLGINDKGQELAGTADKYAMNGGL